MRVKNKRPDGTYAEGAQEAAPDEEHSGHPRGSVCLQAALELEGSAGGGGRAHKHLSDFLPALARAGAAAVDGF